jgi:transcriptional regulator with XRE-family HTH domain
MARKTTEDSRALGRAIRKVRIERGFVQETFARHAGIDRSYVGAIERGEYNVSLGMIFRLADGLGVTPGELLERVER